MSQGRGFVRMDEAPITTDLPHQRPENLNPKHNGPFLDDLRAEQENAYRTARENAENERQKRLKKIDREHKERVGTDPVSNASNDLHQAERDEAMREIRDEQNAETARIVEKQLAKMTDFAERAQEYLVDHITLGDHTKKSAQNPITKKAETRAHDMDVVADEVADAKTDARKSATPPRKNAKDS